MPEARLELARHKVPRDFKSLVSTKFHHPGIDIYWFLQIRTDAIGQGLLEPVIPIAIKVLVQ